ncbi:MAG: restriction endonuclease [Conexivisphaera sp.]
MAGALQDLGFTARVNDRRPSRTGSDVEVDVWAERPVGDMKFTVYASCKNWNRDVDRPVIDEELGRVLNLREMPHLRVLVVRSMGAPAKEVARADGFLVIELGDAVDETNAARAREMIRSKLRGIFVGIAPPELRRLAEMVEDASRVLSNIAGDLRSLAEGARFGADIA